MERYPERCFHIIAPGQPKFDFNTSSISPLYETSYKTLIFYYKQIKMTLHLNWYDSTGSNQLLRAWHVCVNVCHTRNRQVGHVEFFLNICMCLAGYS